MSEPASRGQPYKVCAVRFERRLPGDVDRVYQSLYGQSALTRYYREIYHNANYAIWGLK